MARIWLEGRGGAMRRTGTALVVATIMLGALAGCGDDEPTSAPPADESTTSSSATEPQSKVVDITAQDYAFEAPDNIEGGLIEISFTNAGKEPHFAGLAKV